MDPWTSEQRRLVIGVVLAIAVVGLATQYFVTPRAGTQPFVVFEQTADIAGVPPGEYTYEWKAFSKDQTANECYSEWTVGVNFNPDGTQTSGQTLRNGEWVGNGQTLPAAPPEDVYRCDLNNGLVFVLGTDNQFYLYNGAEKTWTPQQVPAAAVPLPLVRQLQNIACTDTGNTLSNVAVWRCSAPFQSELASIPRAQTMQLFVRGRFGEAVAPWSPPYLIGALNTPQNLRLEMR